MRTESRCQRERVALTVLRAREGNTQFENKPTLIYLESKKVIIIQK